MASSNISTYINKINNAVYGSQVRDAIATGISLCYDDVLGGVSIAESAATAATETANAAAEEATATADAAAAEVAKMASEVSSMKATVDTNIAAIQNTAASANVTAQNAANQLAAAYSTVKNNVASLVQEACARCPQVIISYTDPKGNSSYTLRDGDLWAYTDSNYTWNEIKSNTWQQYLDDGTTYNTFMPTTISAIRMYYRGVWIAFASAL